MSKERQLRKQEEIKQAILDAARDIVAREGIQGLSIRKITKAMDYSPAIIYHYFKDKNEIVDSLVTEGYMRILASIRSVARNEDQPEVEIKTIFDKYIQSSLAAPEVYKAFMLNDDPNVLLRTALLQRDSSKNSPTLQTLCATLQRGIDQGRILSCDIELTAQIIWTSTFGLILKIILEKNLPREQVNRLVDHHFAVLFNGIMVKK